MVKHKKWTTRGRLNHNRFSWWEYLITLILFAVVGGLPGILYTKDIEQVFHNQYVGWYLLYWILVAAIFVTFITIRKYLKYEKPVNKLSTAAKKVADGDFSVYLAPVHRPSQYNYIDLLFENFNQMVAELGSTETLKNDFISNVSHEFKAPLAVIQSYSKQLSRDDLSAAQRQRAAQAIGQATDNLSSLVTNVLRLNKLVNQSINQKCAEFDLTRQLVDCSLDLETQWSVKNIQFEVDLLNDYPIQSDQELLAIVWNNLLNNAIKFTPQNGRIKLKQTVDDNGVLVTISDTGIGMDQKTVKHIFDQFYQGDASHSKLGNGLGLAMVKQIVTMLNGTVSVSSKVGSGSIFTVWLPQRPINEGPQEGR